MLPLDPIIRAVHNIITRFGGTCKVVVETAGNYDASTSSETVVDIEYTVQMIAFDYLQRLAGTGMEMNSLIRNGDKQVFMKLPSGMPLPTPGVDSIIYKDIKHSIITVKDINPSGLSTIVLELYMRE